MSLLRLASSASPQGVCPSAFRHLIPCPGGNSLVTTALLRLFTASRTAAAALTATIASGILTRMVSLLVIERLVIERLEQIEDSVLVSGDVVGCSSRAG